MWRSGEGNPYFENAEVEENSARSSGRKGSCSAAGGVSWVSWGPHLHWFIRGEQWFQGCGSPPNLLLPYSCFTLGLFWSLSFVLEPFLRSPVFHSSLLLLKRVTESPEEALTRWAGVGGWLCYVDIWWGFYFRKQIFKGYFFLALPDSMQSVPPVSCWRELSGHQHSGNQVGKKCQGRLNIQYGSFHQFCFLLGSLVFIWTWSPPAQRHQCSPLPGRELLASGWAGEGQPPAAQSRGEGLGIYVFWNSLLSSPPFPEVPGAITSCLGESLVV